jgi:hypothetical protein
MADVTVPLRVFFNEPADVVEDIDGGLVRSAADRINLGDRFGREIGKKHLAAMRCMVRGFWPPRQMAFGEEVNLLARHLAAVEFALSNLTLTVRAKGVCTAITQAVVARAWYSVDKAKLVHFCTVLKSGIATGPQDEPIILLRDFLVRAEGSRSDLAVVRERYGKIERVLMAFLRGEQPSRLYATTQELFPLPEESAAR